MNTYRTAFVTLVAVPLALTAAWVSADQLEGKRSVVVAYRDLDLSRRADVVILYDRLKRAAREVCKRPTGGFGDPAQFLHCYRDTLAEGVRDLHRPAVTALYVDDNPRVPTVGIL